MGSMAPPFSTRPSTTTLQRRPASAGRDAILKAMHEDGGVIIEGLLTPQQVKQFNQDIDPVLAKMKPGSTHDSEWTQAFHGANTKRLTNLVTHSPSFGKELLDSDLVHELCTEVFTKESGTYWLNTAQVIEIGPGNKAQELHRDQMQYPVFTTIGPNGPEACVNFLVALNDFTEETGATRVIPGSHKWPSFEYDGTPEDTVPVEMKAGDAFFITGKVVHGGGANRHPDYRRRGLAFSFHCSYLTPEEAYPFLISMDTIKTLSPRAQKMVAFRSQFPLRSPGLWQSDYVELARVIGLETESIA
ncbi:Verruculogen synthase [Exophiala xenobiotica]|nr:Verruculogen synthase [Exophiala xenobiotica]KAK5326395.1 Verruculogen synthase [Exophiala xenobiotica]KAK5353085.1 Verruculogen synthase [Exophiala xenobiotica]KAK5379866.1 hypothetical protein LTR11_003494 [Exophiala xenobiotica]KAK5386953.1 Verruculogen synthase [Exophiala xenobiotica]